MKVIPLPITKGCYLATLTLWRRPGGEIEAELAHAPPGPVVQRGLTAANCLRAISAWLHRAGDLLNRGAERLE